MEIAFTTVGSTGDIQPFLALGKALIARGHKVRAISHPFHRERFEKHGIRFFPAGPHVSQDELNEKIDRAIRPLLPQRQIGNLAREGLLLEPENYFRDASAALKGVDLALSHMIDFVGQEAVLQAGIPRVVVILAPGVVPNNNIPPGLAPDLGPLNRVSWSIAGLLLKPVNRMIHKTLVSLGGTEQELRLFSSLSPELNLVASSRYLAPLPDGMASVFAQTGPWILESPAFEPDAALQAFLAKHPRPVVVSFGSMGGLDGGRLTRVIMEALTLLDVPAVVQRGYAGVGDTQLPDHIFQAGFVPHTWLFPQAACVVHHAGAGTTTAVCRAGVPSVTVPWFADQPYFARRVAKLGVGPAPLPQRQLSGPRLARRIRQAINSPAIQNNARILGEKMRSEQGIEAAITQLEQFCASKGLDFSV